MKLNAVRSTSLAVNIFLRLYRLSAVLLAAWMVHLAHLQSVRITTIELPEVRAIFPEARLLSATGEHDVAAVWSGDGRRLGIALTTSPQSDDLIGYSGPSNLLVGINSQGQVAGVTVLKSSDTAAHVSDISQNKQFWKSFVGWNPQTEPLPKIEAVSGSTLTSLAMAESVERRLYGRSGSLRFPQLITLEEARGFFPAAIELIEPEKNSGSTWIRVNGKGQKLLGFIVRSSPASENVRGYRGPSESVLAIAPDGSTIVGVRLRHSYDTTEYVDRVRNDSDFLNLLASHRVEQWPAIDFQKAGIEGVSGATQTSFSVAEGIRRRFALDAAMRQKLAVTSMSTRNIILFAVAIGSLALSLTRLRSSRRGRLCWHVVCVIVLGGWLGDLISLALLGGWSRHGLPISTASGLIALTAIALLTPLGTQRNVYCQHMCPHGIVQGWLGRFRGCHITLPQYVSKWFNRLPATLLVIALVIAVLFPAFDLARLEPFDAWILYGTAAVSATIAVVGLVASLFIPQAYCRYGCPTGALLKFVRSGGAHDCFSMRDITAGVVLLGLWCVVAMPSLAPPGISTSSSDSTTLQKDPTRELPEFRGKAFGTTWSVKFRQPHEDISVLRQRVASEIERIENLLSHWRRGSATYEFNANETTLETEQPAELIQLVLRAKTLSEVTCGSFDITVAPLVGAWGFGPEGDVTKEPSDSELSTLLARVGYEKLIVDEAAGTLKKAHPELKIDLGSILQGYAADRVATVIREQPGFDTSEFLIEVGGELLASGEWQVAIERTISGTPSLHAMTLKDAAIATSGVSRSMKQMGGRTVHHFISPKTGRPIDSDTKSCSVRAPTCLEADGWATALWLAGSPAAIDLANKRGLTVWLYDHHDKLETNESSSTGTQK